MLFYETERSAMVLPADLCIDHAHYVKNHRSTVGVTNGLCEHSRECKHCDFFSASTSRDKKFALRAASRLESTRQQSASSPGLFP